jgi:hypothetical protein
MPSEDGLDPLVGTEEAEAPQMECSACGADIDDGEERYHDGEHYCRDCYHERYSSCADCGEVLERDSGEECFSELLDNGYCESCYNERISQCAACGEEVRSDDTNDSPEGDLCRDCYGERYRTCSNCDRTVPYDDLEYDEDTEEDLCARCYTRRGPIRDHSYGPEPVFHGKGPLFLGIELEVEARDASRSEGADSLASNPLYYLKHDGSLNDGFEVVSHPVSGDWLLENPAAYDDVFALAKRGFRSYDTSTCGMHVHMTRKAFKKLHLLKFVTFVKENDAFTLRVSQRKYKSSMDQWAKTHYEESRYDPWRGECVAASIASHLKHTNGATGDRYTAVNLENENTIEVRIFRGTLNPAGFWKNVEFCLALYAFTENASLRELTPENFMRFVSAYRRRYKHLYAFLVSKIGFEEDIAA